MKEPQLNEGAGHKAPDIPTDGVEYPARARDGCVTGEHTDRHRAKLYHHWRDTVSFERKVDHCLSMLLVLAGSLAAGFACWQLYLTRLSTDAAISALRFAETERRAFLEYAGMTYAGPPVSGKPFWVRMNFRNSGGSAASEVDARGGFDLRDSNPPRSYVDAENPEYPSLPNPGGGEIGPGGERYLFLGNSEFNKTWSQIADEGKGTLYVVGTFSYRDLVGCRRLYFCQQWSSDSAEWFHCATHNRTEDIPCLEKAG